VATSQENLQDRFTAFGMTLTLALGFVLNLAVVLGTVPPKGVAMPFMSYGGSNLLVSFICVGMLLNISRGGGR
jgi:cell division protein FtsW